jgi:hypothetical protein
MADLLYQRRFGGPTAPRDEKGDCFSTSIAALVGESEQFRDALHEVWLDGSDDLDSEDHWWWAINRVLLDAGYGGLLWSESSDDAPDGPVIVSGPSPRGPFEHSVVMNGSVLVHDPLQGGTGLPTPREWMWLVPREVWESKNVGEGSE